MNGEPVLALRCPCGFVMGMSISREMFRNMPARALAKEGFITLPAHFDFVLGVGGALAASVEALFPGARGMVFHLDLYRIMAPQDLTNLAWDEILGANAIVLVEWPDRAGTALPLPDVVVRLAHAGANPGVRSVAW